jgi:hypothetical protein
MYICLGDCKSFHQQAFRLEASFRKAFDYQAGCLHLLALCVHEHAKTGRLQAFDYQGGWLHLLGLCMHVQAGSLHY